MPYSSPRDLAPVCLSNPTSYHALIVFPGPRIWAPARQACFWLRALVLAVPLPRRFFSHISLSCLSPSDLSSNASLTEWPSLISLTVAAKRQPSGPSLTVARPSSLPPQYFQSVLILVKWFLLKALWLPAHSYSCTNQASYRCLWNEKKRHLSSLKS